MSVNNAFCTTRDAVFFCGGMCASAHFDDERNVLCLIYSSVNFIELCHVYELSASRPRFVKFCPCWFARRNGDVARTEIIIFRACNDH